MITHEKLKELIEFINEEIAAARCRYDEIKFNGDHNSCSACFEVGAIDALRNVLEKLGENQ